MRRNTSTTMILSGVAAVLSASGVAVAQVQPRPTPVANALDVPSPSLPQLVAQLDSDSLAGREEAVRVLRSMRLSPRELATLMADPKLSGEQRERLGQLGVDALRSNSRGALGVSFPMRMNRFREVDGVTVDSTERGYDSERVLRAGDVIRSIAGVPVTNPEELRPAIIAHDAGETVELEILRGGRLLRVKLVLGNYDKLPNVEQIREYQYAKAWAIRSEIIEQRVREARKPLEPGISSSEYTRLATAAAPGGPRMEIDRFTDEVILSRDPIAAREWAIFDAQFVAGGVPRARSSSSYELSRMRSSFVNSRNGNIVAPGVVQVPQQIPQPAIRPPVEIADAFREMIENNERIIRNPNTPEAERRLLEDQNRRILQLIRRPEGDR